jgi:DNA-directed RNA polymerase subunit M/transcription elongation factor TFIIS
MMDGRRIAYPANRGLIDETVTLDGMPAVRLRGRRIADGRAGWFYFAPILGSYHSILPDWLKKGDEVEFFEPLPDGSLRSLLLPGIEVAGGSVSRVLLEDGNILLFSNIAGVHQSFYLIHPQELEKVGEIIVDTVYLEEPCPRCGADNVFHHRQTEPRRAFSKCLNCGYDWHGKMRSELILVRKRFERKLARELERHPHLQDLLGTLPRREDGEPESPPVGV